MSKIKRMIVLLLAVAMLVTGSGFTVLAESVTGDAEPAVTETQAEDKDQQEAEPVTKAEDNAKAEDKAEVKDSKADDAKAETKADWEKTIPNDLPADVREAVVEVAKSQLKAAGSRYTTFTKADSEDWDASFVMFVLNYAEVKTLRKADDIRFDADTAKWMKALDKADMLTKEGMPEEGDIVFIGKKADDAEAAVVIDADDDELMVIGAKKDAVSKFKAEDTLGFVSLKAIVPDEFKEEAVEENAEEATDEEAVAEDKEDAENEEELTEEELEAKKAAEEAAKAEAEEAAKAAEEAEKAEKAGLTDQTVEAELTSTPGFGGKLRSLLTSDKGTEISISGYMPEDATVKAFPVKVEIPGQNVLAAYDITIYTKDEDGNDVEWQPEIPLNVSIKAKGLEDAVGELNVYHMENKEAEPELAGATVVSNGIVSFDAEAFSIYAVTDDSTVPVRRYVFQDDDGNVIKTIKVKNGDTLGVPAADPIDGKVFEGWYIGEYTKNADGTVTGNQLSEPIEMSGDNAIPASSVGDNAEVVTVTAVYNDVCYVKFLGQNGRVVETLKCKPGDTIDVSTVSYTPPTAHSFFGWSTEPNKSSRSDVMDNEYTVNADTTIYPVLAAGFFVTFDTNAMGDRASFINPIFVEQGSDVVSCVNVNNAKPTRRGYVFRGWYLEPNCNNQVFDEDITLTDQEYSRLNRTLNLYAKWEAAPTTYQIMYFRQLATDEPDMDDSDKHYEFLQASTLNATTGTTVSYGNIEDHEELTAEYRNNFTVNQSQGTLTTKVKSDGSSVMLVYLDRKAYTITFKRYNKYARSDNGTYGLWLGDENTDRTITYGNNRTTTVALGFYDATRNASKGPWFYQYQYGNVRPSLPTERYENTSDYPVFDGSTYGDETLPDLTIRALYGAYILDKWPEYNQEHFYSAKWYDEGENGQPNTGRVTTGLITMPSGNKTLYSLRLDDNTSEWRKKGTWMLFVEHYVAKDPDNAGQNIDDYELDERIVARVGVTAKYAGVRSYKSGYSHIYSQANTSEGSTVLNWYEASDDLQAFPVKAGKDNIEGAESDNDTVIRMFYKQNKYSVNFRDSLDSTKNYNDSITHGGESVADSSGNIKVYYGSSLADIKPDDDCAPTKDGYTFTGWYEDEACTVPFDFDNKTQSDKETLVYAGWSAHWHVITLNPDGGELHEGQSTWIWKKYGETIDEYTPTRRYVSDPNGNYSYVRYYYTDEGLDPDPRARKAAYVPTSEVQAFIDANTNPTQEENPCEVINGFRKLEDDEQDAWVFQGWYWTNPETGNEEKYSFGVPIRSDADVTAHWRSVGNYKINYIVGTDEQGNPYKDNTGNTIAALPDDAKYDADAHAVASILSAAPAGYKFIGWRDSAGHVIKPNDTFAISRNIAEDDPDSGRPDDYVINLTAVIEKDENAGADTQQRNMYTFYVAENYSASDLQPYYQEYISAGEELIQPTTPEDPTGAGRAFTGWYSDKELRTRFDGFGIVNNPADGTKLYASFNRQHQVTYYDKTGRNIITIQAYEDQALLNTAGITYTDVDEGKMMDGWSRTLNGDVYAPYNRATKTKVTGDLSLYPKQVAKQLLNFDTDGGSYVAPIVLPTDRIPQKPADPTKVGYKFKWWTLEQGSTFERDRFWFEEEEDKPELETGEVPAGKDTLYAVWELDTENPVSADYTIVWWVQNAEKTGYDICKTQKISANVGTVPVGDDWTVAGVDLDDKSNMGTVVSSDNRKYFEFSSNSDKKVVVTPDNKATLNMYFDRTEYTIVFDPNGTGSTFTYKDGEGAQHTNEAAYSITGWFEMPLPSKWPLPSNDGESSPKVNIPGGDDFQGWEYTKTDDTTQGSVTTQAIMDHDMCDSAVQNSGTLTFRLRAGDKPDSNTYFNIEYWFRDDVNSENWVQNHDFDQRIAVRSYFEDDVARSELSAKPFKGYKVDDEKGVVTGGGKYKYYTRPNFYLSYRNTGSTWNPNYVYSNEIHAIKANENTTSGSYSFRSDNGQTYQSNSNTYVYYGDKDEYHRIRISDLSVGNGLVLGYAEDNRNTIKFFYTAIKYDLYLEDSLNTAELYYSGKVPYEQSLESLLDGNAPSTVPEGKKFAGWSTSNTVKHLVDPSTLKMPAGELRLYAWWDEADVIVTTLVNGEEKTYTKPYGTLFGEFPLEAPATVGEAPFAGWKIQGDPDSEILSGTYRVRDNITVVPVAAPFTTIQVTYNYNGGELKEGGTIPENTTAVGNEGFRDNQVYRNGGTPIVLPGNMLEKAEGTTRKTTFVCWNTAANGSGVDFYPGNALNRGVDLTQNVTLYAKYSKFRETSMSYDANGGGLYVGGELQNDITVKFTEYADGSTSYPNTDYAAGKTQENTTIIARRVGYKFTGWSTNPNGPAQFQTGDTVAVDKRNEESENVLYAIWERDEFPVKVFPVKMGEEGEENEDLAGAFAVHEGTSTFPDGYNCVRTATEKQFWTQYLGYISTETDHKAFPADSSYAYAKVGDNKIVGLQYVEVRENLTLVGYKWQYKTDADNAGWEDFDDDTVVNLYYLVPVKDIPVKYLRRDASGNLSELDPEEWDVPAADSAERKTTVIGSYDTVYSYGNSNNTMTFADTVENETDDNLVLHYAAAGIGPVTVPASATASGVDVADAYYLQNSDEGILHAAEQDDLADSTPVTENFAIYVIYEEQPAYIKLENKSSNKYTFRFKIADGHYTDDLRSNGGAVSVTENQTYYEVELAKDASRIIYVPFGADLSYGVELIKNGEVVDEDGMTADGVRWMASADPVTGTLVAGDLLADNAAVTTLPSKYTYIALEDIEKCGLTVRNTIDGQYADLTKKFKVTITLTKGDADAEIASVELPTVTAPGDTTNPPAFVLSNDKKKAVLEVNLGNGEEASMAIPSGWKYSVTEQTASGYALTYSLDNEATWSAEAPTSVELGPDDVKVILKNAFDDGSIVPSGIKKGSMILISMFLAMLLAFGVVMSIRRRRHMGIR